MIIISIGLIYLQAHNRNTQVPYMTEEVLSEITVSIKSFFFFKQENIISFFLFLFFILAILLPFPHSEIVNKYIFFKSHLIPISKKLTVKRGINASNGWYQYVGRASKNESEAPWLSKSKNKWLLPPISYLISISEGTNEGS